SRGPRAVALAQAITECVCDVRITRSRQAETPPDERHGVLATRVAAGWRADLALVATRLDARLCEDGLRVVGSRPIGAVEAVEALPEIVHPRQRMHGGQLGDDTRVGVLAQRARERDEILHVVENVVADDDVGSRRSSRAVRPASLDRLGLDAPLAGGRLE